MNVPELPKYLMDAIGEYGMARTDFAVGSPGHLEAWQLVIRSIKLYAMEAIANERERCAVIAESVDEPPWYGYECPNTFQDGKFAAAEAIRKQP